MQDLRVDAPAYDEDFFESSAAARSAVVRHIHSRTRYALAKRGFDLIVACGLLILTTPIWLFAALLIRITSRGPVVYGQERIGKDGQPFICYKFRTMVEGAHDLREQLLDLNRMTGPVFKTPDDPRVTTVGRWLRKSSVDELPQLLNVLRGEMSIVGPRPQSQEEVDRYGPSEWGRLSVKPGMTCVWQVSGRMLVDPQTRMQMDLDYARQCSFAYDCVLVLRTIPAVLTGRGAY